MEKDQHNQIDFDDDQIMILEPLSKQEEEKIMQQHLDNLKLFYQTNEKYEIDYWYDELKEFTFKSYKLQLTAIDTYIIHWLYYNDSCIQDMNPKIKQVYQSLIKKIDNFIQSSFGKNGNCFMKLSTRSPKDHGWRYKSQDIQKFSENLVNYIKKETHSQKIKDLTDQIINQIYLFFLQISKQKFKISSGLQFLDIFSKSQRIIIDLNDFSTLENNIFSQFKENNFQNENKKMVNIWAREWKDFQWKDQIRVFYCNYAVTAISQYDQRCYFKGLQNQKEAIKEKVLDLFQKLKPKLIKLELSNGVIDMIVRTQKSQIYAQMIEINVFNSHTRGSLFSWQNQKQLLQKGPVQVRILQKPIHIDKNQLLRMMGMIEHGIQPIIEKSMQKLGLVAQWSNYS